MSVKISELTAADTLTGTEELPLVQSSTTKKITVNDLLPVQLQEDKTIDLNGKEIIFDEGGHQLLYLDATTNNEIASMRASDDTGGGNVSYLFTGAQPTSAQTEMQANFDGGTKSADILMFSDATSGTITYTADFHAFHGEIGYYNDSKLYASYALLLNNNSYAIKTDNYPGNVFLIQESGANSLDIEFGDLDGDGNGTKIIIGDNDETIILNASNIITPELIAKDFLDDTAAATGLVPVGGLYHTAGVLKIRLA